MPSILGNQSTCEIVAAARGSRVDPLHDVEAPNEATSRRETKPMVSCAGGLSGFDIPERSHFRFICKFEQDRQQVKGWREAPERSHCQTLRARGELIVEDMFPQTKPLSNFEGA